MCKICGNSSDDKGNLYREKVYRVIDKSVGNKKDANLFQEIYQKICSDLRFNKEYIWKSVYYYVFLFFVVVLF